MIAHTMNRTDFVYEWLKSTSIDILELSAPAVVEPFTPPSSLVLSTNNKRARDMSESRSSSPSKRQCIARDDDDIFPEQSASDIVVTELSERTRLSRVPRSITSSPKRAVSPVRDLLNDLRSSEPAILCELPTGVDLPESVLHLQRILTRDIEEKLIPEGLKPRILASYPLIADNIPELAYDTADTKSERELSVLWEWIEDILNESRDCGRYQQDENAWCMKVIHPTLRQALKGRTMLKVESVQSQAINPEMLPTTPKNYRVQRKADYTFAFHRNTPHVSELYRNLNLAGVGSAISQTTDANTQRLALFSGIEVKQENGGKDEALAQLAIWLAAGLKNLKRLGERSRKQPYSCNELLPTVGWTVIGHDWHTYIAYTSSENRRDVFYVIGPWRAAAANTRDVYGVFKLLRVIENAAEYASNVYWPWLQEDILMNLIK